MKMLEAMQDTINLAKERGYDTIEFEQIGVDAEHLDSMLLRAADGLAAGTFSQAKLGRWLGYVQGVLVANDAITLEEAKEINKRWRD